MMKITLVTQITDKLVVALSQLLPQLSPSAQLPDKVYLEEMINSGCVSLFIAEDENRIVGTLTLVIYNLPSGRKAWIEDVVTDQDERGRGIAPQLVNSALQYAKDKGLKKVDLTSSNERVAAHGLYEKMNFKKRDTVVFRKEL